MIDRGYKIGNVDVTLILQAPKVGIVQDDDDDDERYDR